MGLAMTWARTIPRMFGTALAAIVVPFCGIGLTVGACIEAPVARLVPLRCGVGSLTWIRVQTRGDVPPGVSTAETVGLEVRSLDDLPDGITAVTVEGLFGTDVEAVGRTAVLQPEGDLPVYFAPPDTVCEQASPVAPREVGALALSERGHGVIVGGRDESGRLLDDVVYFSDTFDHARVTSGHLPLPSLGQTVHATGPTDFLVLGGAGANRSSFASAVHLHVVRPGLISVGDPQPLTYEGTPLEGRAYHAAGVIPDGRIMMTGGCGQSVDGGCEPTGDSVLNGTWFVEGTSLSLRPGPELTEPRYDHDLLIGRDGVAIVAGGRTVDAVPVQTLEVLLPGGSAWTPYGPSIRDWLVGGVSVVGATLLEGGVVVLQRSDGALLWVDQHHRGTLVDWCTGAACADAVSSDPAHPTMRRHLLTLPGERVVSDSWLIGPALLNMSGNDAIDLALPAWEGAYEPPESRVGARPVLLRDGSVLMVGGWGLSGHLASPWIVRLRPALDGPDERIPELRNLEPGALVLHDPGEPELPRVTSSGATLRIAADDSGDTLVSWVHVRSFRSRAFRFEVVLTTLAEARPRLVFSFGAIARVEIHFDRDGVRFAHHEADGTVTSVSCDREGIDFSGLGQNLRVDASRSAIDVSIGEREIGCPGLPASEAAVGFGVVGNGSLVAQGLRLTR